MTLVRATLGPTNTGKTHGAIERMLDHESGIIGLPLRLLAREVYDRVCARVGARAVALVTGEEKRVPAQARYWICTVEAMPESLDADFVAVDEIQLAAHPQRGHIFTDRLLRARGRRETCFLGADTMRAALETLVPSVRVERRPRLSTLSGAGQAQLSAVPPRSAIVAFSATRVYELAERVRHKRGGAAVVLGALSPRARNAQVAMYQAGEVDYLVATDAIGMGLNLDVDHVAFAETRKYDGSETRELDAAELAQIAGRAGRYVKDGTFGTLAPQAPLNTALVRAIERSAFPAERRLWFRNAELDFSSLDALAVSLRRRPPHELLRLVEPAEDERALIRLASDINVRALAREPSTIELLWGVCQIPDYRQILFEAHVELLRQVFLQLAGPRGRVEHDYLRKNIEAADDINGDIDALIARMAAVRTWNYVASHGGWVQGGREFQELARAVEDRLSDALHVRLVARFVERRRRTAAFRPTAGSGKARPQPRDSSNARGPTAPRPLDSAHPFAALAGLRVDERVAAPRILSAVEAAIDAPPDRFRLRDDGAIVYSPMGHGAVNEIVLGSLMGGPSLLMPEARLAPDVAEELRAGARTRLLRRLVAAARDFVGATLEPIRVAQSSMRSAHARGILYQIEQGLGAAWASELGQQLAALSDSEREAMKTLGVEIGLLFVFVPALHTPDKLATRRTLSAAFRRLRPDQVRPRSGEAPSFRAVLDVSPPLHLALGYAVLGPRAVRVDIAEDLARRAHQEPSDNLEAEAASILAAPEREARVVIAAIRAAMTGEPALA